MHPYENVVKTKVESNTQFRHISLMKLCRHCGGLFKISGPLRAGRQAGSNGQQKNEKNPTSTINVNARWYSNRMYVNCLVALVIQRPFGHFWIEIRTSCANTELRATKQKKLHLISIDIFIVHRSSTKQMLGRYHHRVKWASHTVTMLFMLRKLQCTHTSTSISID